MLQREIEALRERTSALSAAIPRISATLDLHTVLAEVVESARTLAGARYGVIVTVDEAGAHPRFRVRRLHAGRPAASGMPFAPSR